MFRVAEIAHEKAQKAERADGAEPQAKGAALEQAGGRARVGHELGVGER